MTLQALIDRLEDVHPSGDGFMARCPAHDDRKASLSVTERDGRILLHCHAGCPYEKVRDALGLKNGDLRTTPRPAPTRRRIVATYDYESEDGTLLFQVVRYQPKDFRQRRPDGRGGWAWKLGRVRRVLYRLPELLAADPERSVFVCEGEKAVDRLVREGLVATCSPGGAGKWRDEYAEALRGRDVVVLPDNDTPGRFHAETVARSLAGVAADVRVLDLPGLPAKGDVYDWLEAGHTAEDLQRLAAEEPEYEPSPPPPGFVTGPNDRDNGHRQAPLDLTLDVPPLPVGVTLPEATPSEWLDGYIEYASAISPMTPRLFHESAGLWLGAVAIARRLVVPMAFGKVYPNLWALWVAPTTLYRKTTALTVAERLAQQAFPHLLAPSETTPEAMLSDLAGKEPTGWENMGAGELEEWQRERDFAAQRGLLLDELSGLTASFGRDYNAGLLEALLRFYDCTPRYVRSTRGQGRVTVRNAYLSILGGSTPAAMAPHLGAERLWSNGWWPRFALLCPEGKPAWAEPQEVERPQTLDAGLQQLHERLPKPAYPKPPETLMVTLDDGVHHVWANYNRALSYTLLDDTLDGRLYGSYGRLPVQALKIATILAAMDWPAKAPAPRIEMRHLGRALDVTESWRAAAHRVLTMTTDAQEETTSEKVLKYVARAGEQGATLRELYRPLNMSAGECELALRDLLRTGEVEIMTQQKGRGRPTKRYRLVKNVT